MECLNLDDLGVSRYGLVFIHELTAYFGFGQVPCLHIPCVCVYISLVYHHGQNCHDQSFML